MYFLTIQIDHIKYALICGYKIGMHPLESKKTLEGTVNVIMNLPLNSPNLFFTRIHNPNA